MKGPWVVGVTAAIAAIAGCGEFGRAADGATPLLRTVEHDMRPGGSCDLDPPAVGLLVTTTDFATGAVSSVDLASATVATDLVMGTTDAIPFWHRGFGYVVHRIGYDFVERLDPQRGLRSVGQYPIDHGGTRPSNPHAIAFAPDGLAYVTGFGSATIDVLDLARSPAEARVDRIRLDALAPDGNPDPNLAVRCGDLVFVSLDQVEADFTTTGHELIAIDTATRSVVADEDGQPRRLRTAGTWIKQLRRDPADSAGTTLLALTTGIERIDLEAGTTEWASGPEGFAAVGIRSHLQLQAFDVDAMGEVAYVAAYDPDYAQVQLYMVGLDGTAPRVATAFADDLDSRERTLEVVGGQLWYGSSRRDAPGLWVFDITADSPVVVAGPLATGLPPYSITVIADP